MKQISNFYKKSEFSETEYGFVTHLQWCENERKRYENAGRKLIIKHEEGDICGLFEVGGIVIGKRFEV